MRRAVILTALQVEYSAVRANLTDLQEETHLQGTVYERGRFIINEQTWEVGIAEIGAGNAGVAVEAERAIAYFKPDVLFLVGIARGIKDVAIGDVVAATKVYGYESGRVGEQFFTHPALGQSAHALVQRARAEARKGEWLKRLSSSPASQPRVFIAPIAAGEKVVASKESDVFNFIRTSYNDAIAVEMEGFGFLSAVFAHSNTKAIVIRGIYDLVEKNEDSSESEQERQSKASRYASAFAFEALAKLHNRKRKPGLEGSVKPTTSQTIVDSREHFTLSDLSELATKFREAPENVTDSSWQNWFDEMFELQFKVLQDISFKIGRLLNAHRTTVYFIEEGEKDKKQKELWSIFAQGDTSLEIRVPFGEGISGKVVESKQVSFVPYDAHKYVNSKEIRSQDARTGYRTYTLMTLPLLNARGDLIAVFQFINKLIETDLSKSVSAESEITKKDIDKRGFTQEDQNKFNKYIVEIRSTLELYQHYYNLSKKWQSIINFSSATLSLGKQGQDLEEILKTIINEARKITNADRGTFWLLDRKGKTLQAKIPNQDGSYRNVEIKVGEGFAGEVAESKTTLNIPYDLYQHPKSGKARETDQRTGYRSCSLLCMPVLSGSGDLIGVTQLVNKRNRQSKYQEYLPENYPKGSVPEFFKASFSSEDEERLIKFNEQVAAAIQNAQRSVMVDQYSNLFHLLHATSQLASGYLNAHKAIVFLIDEDTKVGKDKKPRELWTITSNDEDEEPHEISMPIGYEEYIDLPGQLAKTFLDSPQDTSRDSIFTVINYKNGSIFSHPFLCYPSKANKSGKYKVFNRLVLPLFKKIGKAYSLVAVIDFLNKLKIGVSQDHILSENIVDIEGFNEGDKESLFYDYDTSLTRLIETFLDIYKPVNQYLDTEKLFRTREFIFQDKSDSVCSFEERIKMIEEKVKSSARRIVGADRCTLWRVDPKDRAVLFADIPDKDGVLRRILMGSPKRVRMHCSGEQSTKLPQHDSPTSWKTITSSVPSGTPVDVRCN